MSANSLVLLVDHQSFSAAGAREKAERRKEVLQACAAGRIVIFKGVDFGLKAGQFSDIPSFPQRFCKIGIAEDQSAVDCARHAKLPVRLLKAGGDKLASPYLGAKDLQDVLDHSFEGEWSRFERFIETCRSVESILRTVARDVLHDYDYYSDCVVLRFSQPECTKLHFDPNPNLESKESLRFFVNLDSQPRRWRCSRGLVDLVEQEYFNLDLARYFVQDSKDRMGHMIKKIMSSSALLDAPRVDLEFEPNDVWIFDGRVIAHQVVEGFRAFSLTAKMWRNVLPDYHTDLKTRLFAIHERLRAECLV
jgi:hypothetical protein